MSKRGPSRHQTLKHFCNTMGLLGFFKDYILGFLDYETPKVMVVRNRNLGVIYRGVQFLVITYFIWYVFIKEKAYQDFESGLESSVTTRMKGTAVQGGLVHDSEEYAHPSEGFEVMSTTVRRDVTHDQRQATCAEHFSVPNANCSEDSDCREGEVDFDGHGPRTGRCVPYYDQSFRTCEIQAWCPVEEYAAVREPPLLEAFNFTIVIKNAIRFPKFNVSRANVKDFPKKRQLSQYLARCHYHAVTEPYCPVFRLGYIAQRARQDWAELCQTGGVIGVFINWQCDFDLSTAKCKPTYSFRLLDTRKDLPTAGYYYRFAKYYSRDGVESRTLIKAYGVRLDIIVHGYAGKFGLIPTIINSVTALGSVGVCSILCDWILLTFIDKDEIYSNKMFDDSSKDPVQPNSTAFTIVSYGSNHSDLSEGVAL
ncbi:P2X purinoceptor 2 [Gadus morhua]|uniref:P2X purinoceptor n=1 Tax=Gadus morhua TaxID=8049 RepID=A0A8C4ZV50_GADMO|nr:P2X purinoceptor 2 [Gadus morhua]